MQRILSKDGACQTEPIQIEQKTPFVKKIENSLHEKFALYDEQLYESECQIKAFEGQVNDFEDAIEAKVADVKEVQGKLDSSILASVKQRSEAEEQLRELKEQITDLQDALNDRDSQVETLQRQLDLAYSENNEEMCDAESQLKNFRKQIASFQDSLDKKDAQVEKLQRKLERADHQHQSKIDDERDEADFQLKDFRKEVTSLQEALDEKDAMAIEMQGQLDEAECENKIMMEELDDLLQEKIAAEAKATTGGEGDGDITSRIKDLEQELKDATNVANLQLEELDEQVDELQDKVKAERLDSVAKMKTRDATIDELENKLRKYEAVSSTTHHSFSFKPSMHQKSMHQKVRVTSFDSEQSGTSFANASIALPDVAAEIPAISTDDVTDIEKAKQKVYEARADATSVRESLEISTKKCADLTLVNEQLTKINSELVDTTWERDELKDKVRDWTAQTYEWKRRFEESESKLHKITKSKNNGSTDEKNTDTEEIDHQGMMIQAAMGKTNNNIEEKKTGGWSLFGRSSTVSNNNSASVVDPSNPADNKSTSFDLVEAKDIQIEGLEDTITKLRSELFQMSTTHKEEAYLTKKQINQLEGENEALAVQNSTLEQLAKFHGEH